MDRPIVYAGENPLADDFLNASKYAMIGLGYLMQAVLGTSTLVDGLACAPTAPPSLDVTVAAGSIMSLANIDGTSYGTLDADTTHSIVKQGILLDAVTLSCPAPATTGFSTNYLVEAAYQDTDTGPTTLPYYNSSNPDVAYSGPGGSGDAQNTIRKGQCIVQVKAGIAATTGSQTTPAVDAGYTGLWVVTVAHGATTITSGNITQVSGAPFISEKLGDKISEATGDARYLLSGVSFPSIQGSSKNLAGAWASNTTATWTADQIVLQNSSSASYLAMTFNETLNIATAGAGGLDTGSLAASTWYYVFAIWNGTTQNILVSASATAPTLPSGYTYFARIGSVYLDGSKHIIGFAQAKNRTSWVLGNNLSSIRSMASGSSVTDATAVSVSSFVPPTAKKIQGSLRAVSIPNAGWAAVAPNATYAHATNSPCGAINASSGDIDLYLMFDFLLESTNIYWGCSVSGSGTLVALGYEDNL